MRQHPLLRWIEQAEARKVADAAFHERVTLAAPEFQSTGIRVTRTRPSRRLLAPMTLLRRWRPSRVANDTC